MKTRPIGTIVARNPTCNLILRTDVQDPQKGFAMGLAEDLNTLSEGQRMELKSFLQSKMDSVCDELAEMIQTMRSQPVSASSDQTVLDLDPTMDNIEIPPFFRRNQ